MEWSCKARVSDKTDFTALREEWMGAVVAADQERGAGPGIVGEHLFQIKKAARFASDLAAGLPGQTFNVEASGAMTAKGGEFTVKYSVAKGGAS